MRKITSMTMVWSLIILIINSLVLYVVPEGRVSHWADWRFLGLTKSDWSAQHTTVGFLFLFAGLLHIYNNWKPIRAYMKNKARQFRLFTGASTVGFILTAIFVFGTYLNVPPLSTIIELSEHFKDSASLDYGEPPYGQAQSSSLKMFTAKLNLDLAESMKLIEAAGIGVADEKETIRDIADRAGTSPQQIYEIIKPATGQPASENGQTHSSSTLLTNAPSGVGRKTISQVCAEIGQDCEMIIRGLKEKGVDAKADKKLKDIGTENDTGPMQIYEMIVEVSVK
ncbi:MAG: DUF4405 domain-containing protein [Desulfocapsaceae bacterium]|nr:DUF4405 domain-containing protein [Desulfocapsaceae bacterium]